MLDRGKFPVTGAILQCWSLSWQDRLAKVQVSIWPTYQQDLSRMPIPLLTLNVHGSAVQYRKQQHVCSYGQ